MNYASVCSGVEAASLAWHSLGWEPVFFSEIEPFPCAVLKHRFPNVPNLGDMTKIEGEKYRGTVDILVGGTPCQGFSVAGKQGGLDDPRSALCLKYIDLLKTMRPRWFVWENVPGVFSTNGGNDFARFISEIENIGYGVAWRVLDAQYVRTYQFPHAVPQRRRRVFVVGHLGEWQYPASVLFEPDCLFGDTPPRRTKRERLAADPESGADSAVPAHRECIDIRQINVQERNLAPTLIATDYKGGKAVSFYTQRKAESMVPLEECSNTLVNGTCPGHQNKDVHAVAYREKMSVVDMMGGKGRCGVSQTDVSPVISADTQSHAVARKECVPLDLRNATRDPEKHDAVNRQGVGIGEDGDPMNTVTASSVPGIGWQATVRRLLPVECERLMGFPDNWTRIPFGRKEAKDCPDAPRYKACGNSMCVNVMQWIGARIQRVENIKEASK